MAREATNSDAIALLKTDHQTAKDLFQKFKAAGGKAAKQKLAHQICFELSVHMAIEEEIFYPEIEGVADEAKIAEGLVEHDSAKLMMAEILADGVDERFYDAKVEVLCEEAVHHMDEEKEKGGLFDQTAKSEIDLEEMGARLAQRKQELTDAYKANGVPTPTTRTLKGAEVHHGLPEA